MTFTKRVCYKWLRKIRRLGSILENLDYALYSKVQNTMLLLLINTTNIHILYINVHGWRCCYYASLDGWSVKTSFPAGLSFPEVQFLLLLASHLSPTKLTWTWRASFFFSASAWKKSINFRVEMKHAHHSGHRCFFLSFSHPTGFLMKLSTLQMTSVSRTPFHKWNNKLKKKLRACFNKTIVVGMVCVHAMRESTHILLI